MRELYGKTVFPMPKLPSWSGLLDVRPMFLKNQNSLCPRSSCSAACGSSGTSGPVRPVVPKSSTSKHGIGSPVLGSESRSCFCACKCGQSPAKYRSHMAAGNVTKENTSRAVPSSAASMAFLRSFANEPICNVLLREKLRNDGVLMYLVALLFAEFPLRTWHSPPLGFCLRFVLFPKNLTDGGSVVNGGAEKSCKEGVPIQRGA